MADMRALIALLRPHQWLKNGFVFVGLLFGHAWHDSDKLHMALLAALAFCLVSSAVYVFNDLADREADRLHPRKRQRPLAAGSVSVQAAVILAVALLVGGGLAAWAASPMVLTIVSLYLILNLAYSVRLKRVVILDVFVIAAGFMLRLLAGTLGLGIPPSSWLLLTGLMVTLFLGFTKRHAELMGTDDAPARAVLRMYSRPMLELMIGVCASGVVVFYGLYTMSPETVAVHHTDRLVWTLPFVLYGLFRYLYFTFNTDAGEDPARDLLRDPHLLVTLFGWVALTAWLLA